MIRTYVIAAGVAMIAGVVLGELMSSGSTVSLWDMGGHVLLALVLGAVGVAGLWVLLMALMVRSNRTGRDH